MNLNRSILTDVTNFNELRRIYSECFSLGYINPNNERSLIENKFVLISLICYITYKAKDKDPDATHYSIIRKLSKGIDIPDEFIRGLAVVCEDFAYNCTKFPTFGLKGQDIIKECRGILKSYMPF